jgi:hypothetical protein
MNDLAIYVIAFCLGVVVGGGSAAVIYEAQMTKARRHIARLKEAADMYARLWMNKPTVLEQYARLGMEPPKDINDVK